MFNTINGNESLDQGLRNPHDLAVDPSSRSVYVGELNPQAVWKLSRAGAVPTPVDHHEHPATEIGRWSLFL